MRVHMQTRTRERMPQGHTRQHHAGSCVARGSSDTCTDRSAVGLYLFTQGKHSSSLDYCNLFFVSQILKHKNGGRAFYTGPHIPVQTALTGLDALPRGGHGAWPPLSKGASVQTQPHRVISGAKAFGVRACLGQSFNGAKPPHSAFGNLEGSRSPSG